MSSTAQPIEETPAMNIGSTPPTTSEITSISPARPRRRLVAMAVAFGIAFAAFAGVGATLGSSPASAAGVCRDSRTLPSASPMRLVGPGGATVHLQRGNRNYRITSHVWINSRYAGQYDVPLSVGSDIRVMTRYQTVNELWMGRYRSTIKVVPYVRVCGAWANNPLP